MQVLSRYSKLLIILGFASFGCSSKSEPSVTSTDAQIEDTSTDTSLPKTDAKSVGLLYPARPYGLKQGEVFPRVKFKGYRAGSSNWEGIDIAEYYDPDGSKGINAILYVVSAEWCNPCREETKELPKLLDCQYKSRGAKFIQALVEDKDGDYASQPTLERWIKQFKLNYNLVLDDEHITWAKGAGIPLNFFIDPRTMKIVRIKEGVSTSGSSIPGLHTLLDSNQAPPASPTENCPINDAGPNNDSSTSNDTGAISDSSSETNPG